MNHRLLTKKRSRHKQKRRSKLRSKQYQQRLALKTHLLESAKTRLRIRDFSGSQSSV